MTEQLNGTDELIQMTIICFSTIFWGFPSGAVVKNLPALQEMWV